jgi:multidrug transporter EmrE-like cation transporter
MWLLFIGLLVLFELVADVFAKEWSLGRPWWFAAAALFFFLVCNSFWLLALKSGAGLARGVVLFAVGTTLTASTLGILWYREHLSPTQLVGIALGLISVGLLIRE